MYVIKCVFENEQTVPHTLMAASLRVLESMHVAFGMGHEAEDVAARVADASDIANRAVGIGRIGCGRVQERGRGRRGCSLPRNHSIHDWYLIVCLQTGKILRVRAIRDQERTRAGESLRVISR